jgi:hypothetical protein
VGCGIGCAVALLAGAGACVLGALYLRHTFRGIEKASESHDALVGALGEVDAFVPPADGAPSPDRLELFLEVREATAPERHEAERLLARIASLDLQEGSTAGRIRVGLGVLGDLIDGIGVYLQARDRTLLERRMGVGEYVYLYTLAYHSWLGHEPAEGARAEADGARIDAFDDDHLFGDVAVRRRYRRYVLGMIERQRDAAANAPGLDQAWRAALEEESRRMEVDPGRVLWRDNLPPTIADTLSPFRPRLEATWSAHTNRLELPLAEHEAPWDRE